METGTLGVGCSGPAFRRRQLALEMHLRQGLAALQRAMRLAPQARCALTPQ